MVKTYKNIKEIAYTTVLGGLLLLNVATTSLAQEGTIDGNFNGNGEIPNQSNISDKVSTTEQPDISDKIEEIEQPKYLKEEYLKELADQINFNVDKDLENRLEIGGKQAYKVIIDGREYCSVEGSDNLFLRVEIKNKNLSSYTEIINYAIGQGFKEVLSAIRYTPNDVNFFRKSKEEDCAYILTNIKNMKSSTQEGGE